jgi:hypothetical protein
MLALNAQQVHVSHEVECDNSVLHMHALYTQCMQLCSAVQCVLMRAHSVEKTCALSNPQMRIHA